MESAKVYSVCVGGDAGMLEGETLNIFSSQEKAEKWIEKFIFRENKWHLRENDEDMPNVVKSWIGDKMGYIVFLQVFTLDIYETGTSYAHVE